MVGCGGGRTGERGRSFPPARLSSKVALASTNTPKENPLSESPELLPVTEKKSSCGCHEHSDERLTLDARAIPHRLRHAAVIGAASSLNPGEGFDLVAPHVPTPLLAQIDQLPFTFQHTLLEQSEGFARVEILRTA